MTNFSRSIIQPILPIYHSILHTYHTNIPMMNFDRLRKHFPELAHLDPEQQTARLTQADKFAIEHEHPLAALSRKLLNSLVIFAIALFFTRYLSPALNIAPELGAAFIIVGLLPGYFVVQQKLYLIRLRKALKKLSP
jgi:hypothetical protein